MATVWIVLTQLVLLQTATASILNVAQGKPASMSSIGPGNYRAGTAVDGNIDAGGFKVSQIMHTATGRTFAWWKVDLQREVQNAPVRIYFRTDYKARRNGVRLYTSTSSFSGSNPSSQGQLCHTVTGRKDGSYIPDVYNATCPGRWRYLLLYTDTDNNGQGPVLDFGEVEVYACSVGTYGEDCTKTCSSRNCVTMTTTCERDGRCPDGCESGWMGLDCIQACNSGSYGPVCSLLCSNRKCKEPSTECNHVTGQCRDGCKPGYKGIDCVEECESGTYGDCTLSCIERKCFDQSSECNHETGQCEGGCQAGYQGIDCRQACDSGYYGSGCRLLCSNRNCVETSTECDHVTGLCRHGCKSGYKGIDCVEECEPGTYGNCSLSCADRKCLVQSDKCNHMTGQCEGGCQAGYEGRDCRQACDFGIFYGVNCGKLCTDRHCSQPSSECDTRTGQCIGGCQVGWRGVDCTSQCPADTFGSNCTSCTTRHCQGESDCAADGTCSQGCQDGWTGNTCLQECSKGMYGPGCNNACGNCSSDKPCDHVAGNCPSGCKAGWRTERCDKVCIDGTYGPGCEEKCGKCDGVCDSVDGRCPAGCLDGYNGTKCDVAVESASTAEPGDVIIPAAGGAAAALVVIVIIIVVVVVCRRKRSKRPKNGESQKLDAAEDYSRKRRGDSPDNMYVNIAMEQENQTQEKAAVVADKPKPPIAKTPSMNIVNDQSEEILDEGEAPSSSPYYNIDEEDLIREVAVEDLAAIVQKIKSREGGFESEYNRLPTGFTATYADSQKEENTGKNKFRGYYPYDHNRVRLSLLPDVPGSDYINASIMHNFNETKTYIGAQAPKKITLGDFWRMIWEQRCARVVMLTGLVEDSKVKCYQYWPEDDLLTTDHFRVTLEDTDTRANYTIRTMKVEKIETGERRSVVQYHYTTWPDHGVPDTLSLVNFIWMMRRTHTRTDGPLLVHCSAGIGRTGTYIAVDSLLDQAREEGKVDVQGYVSIMRGQRKNMIQTTDQYECVFNCLVEMTKYGNTRLTVDDFSTLYTNSGMDARVDSDGKTFGELAQMMLAENDTGASVKNRMWVDGNQEFIVRTAPSLRSVRGHLLCESPHPGQEKLLWKLVEENNVNNVIVLDSTQMDLVGRKGTTKTFEEIKLTTEEQTKLTSDLSLSKLLLLQITVHQGKKKQLLHFHKPVSVESLSDSFLEHSHLKLMTSELSSKTVVHSSTDRKVGVMFCMFGNLMSEIQEDETVDVLHQVRSFTRIFPDITLTKDDVKQLFDFARRCAQLTASTYANM